MESSFDLGMFLNGHEKKHKHKPTQFRSVAGGIQKRFEDNLKHQRSSRLSTIDSIRNIPKCESPAPLSLAQLKIEHRRQQLDKWKQEKEKRKKEEAAKRKKPFVTGVVRNPIAFNPPPQLPTRKVMQNTSDRVTRSQTLKKTNVTKTKTVATETKHLSFAPINAQFRPPQTVNLAKAPVLVPWIKNQKSKNTVEEIESVTKNTKKSTSVIHTRSKAAQNNLDTKLTQKQNTKTENGNLLRTRGGRYVKKPMNYLQSSSSSEIEKFTEKIQSKTVPRKTMTNKSPKRPVPKSESSSEQKLRSPKSPPSQLAAETCITEITPNRSSQRETMPKNDTIKSPGLNNQLREEQLQLNNSAKSPITPEQIKELCQQISPFVTRSRGKDKARQEMMKKIEEGLLDEDASNMDSVQHFRQQLNSEIQRMTELCDSWDKTANQNDLPEMAQELLLGAVGQARLLMSAKLQQFAALVARCERPEPGVALVTPADLHGFWDMVYMQIENINARFSKLDELRSRGWVEELPGPSAAPSRAPGRVPSRAPDRPPRARPPPSGQPSRLREMIAAARRAKKEQQAPSTPPGAGGESGESGASRESGESGASGAGGESGESKLFEAGFFSVRSPVRAAAPRAPSLLRLVLSSEADKSAAKRRASYAMLRASLLCRDAELEGVEPLQQTPVQTTPAGRAAAPGRSILKSSGSRKHSTRKAVKKIVYFDDSITTDTGEKEQDTQPPPNGEQSTTRDGETTDADEDRNKENERRDAVEERSPILTRSRRKTLDAPEAPSEASPRRRGCNTKGVPETAVAARSTPRKKPLREAREPNGEAPAPRRSSRRSAVSRSSLD